MPVPAQHPFQAFACANSADLGQSCQVDANHELDLLLCADLETLADGLPALPPTRELRRLCERLGDASKRWAGEDGTRRYFDQDCVAFRIADSIHAEDLTAELWRYWREPDAGQCGQLSYMLRAMFDGRRRAVAVERLVLGCSACQASASD